MLSFKDSLKSPTDTDNQSSSGESDHSDQFKATPYKPMHTVQEGLNVKTELGQNQEILNKPEGIRNKQNMERDRRNLKII
jgi:hypothetical protein